MHHDGPRPRGVIGACLVRLVPAIAAIASVVVCVPLHAQAADTAVEQAQAAARKGDARAAALLYRGWLDKHAGADGYDAIFAAYWAVERDFASLAAAGLRYLETGKGAPGAAASFARVAGLLEMTGRVEEARDAWLAAYAETPTEAAIVAAAVLSLRLNDAQALSRCLELSRGSASERFVAALALHAAGAPGAADALAAVAARAESGDLAIKALWLLSRWGGQAAAAMGGVIVSRWPLSPEAALVRSRPGPEAAASSIVRLTAAPAFDLEAAPQPAAGGTAASPSADPSPPSSPGPAPSPGLAVQAGAFADPENADELAKDLAKRGFKTRVVREGSGASARSRVLVGGGLDAAAAKDLLAQVVRAGYSGFVTADP